MKRLIPAMALALGLLCLLNFAIAVAASGTFIAAVAAPTNVIRNGDFENSTAEWNLEVAIAEASATWMLDATTAAHGKNSARITILTRGTINYHVWFEQRNVPVISGTHYILSFWARLRWRAASAISSSSRSMRPGSVTATTARWYWHRSGAISIAFHRAAPVLSQGPRRPAWLRGRGRRRRRLVDDIRLIQAPLIITPDEATLKRSATELFSVAYGMPPYTWTSSNPTVGAISPSGNGDNASFLAQEAGTTTLTVVDANGNTTTAIVTVITQSQIIVDAGETVLTVAARSVRQQRRLC